MEAGFRRDHTRVKTAAQVPCRFLTSTAIESQSLVASGCLEEIPPRSNRSDTKAHVGEATTQTHDRHVEVVLPGRRTGPHGSLELRPAHDEPETLDERLHEQDLLG